VLKGNTQLLVLPGFNRLDQAAVNTAQCVDLFRVSDGGQSARSVDKPSKTWGELKKRSSIRNMQEGS